MKLVSMQELCGAAAALAEDVLCDGGVFLCKALQGTHIPGVCVCVCVCVCWVSVCEFVDAGFLTSLRGRYKTVRDCRLKSTRKESTEIYLLARGFYQAYFYLRMRGRFCY